MKWHTLAVIFAAVIALLPLGGPYNQQPGKQSPAIVSGTWFEMLATHEGKAFLTPTRLSGPVGPSSL